MVVRIKKKKIGENFLIPLMIKMLPYLLFNQNVTLFTIEQDGGTKIYDKQYDKGVLSLTSKCSRYHYRWTKSRDKESTTKEGKVRIKKEKGVVGNF